MVRKKIIDHSHGVFRQMDGFVLKRDGPLEKSLQPVSESERIFHIVKKNRGELMKNVEADNETYLLEQSLQPLTKSERIF